MPTLRHPSLTIRGCIVHTPKNAVLFQQLPFLPAVEQDEHAQAQE